MKKETRLAAMLAKALKQRDKARKDANVGWGYVEEWRKRAMYATKKNEELLKKLQAAEAREKDAEERARTWERMYNDAQENLREMEELADRLNDRARAAEELLRAALERARVEGEDDAEKDPSTTAVGGGPPPLSGEVKKGAIFAPLKAVRAPTACAAGPIARNGELAGAERLTEGLSKDGGWVHKGECLWVKEE